MLCLILIVGGLLDRRDFFNTHKAMALNPIVSAMASFRQLASPCYYEGGLLLR